MATVSDQLRKAIETSGLSQNELARRSGVPVSGICRFLAGQELRTGNIDRLCHTLGLKLTAKSKRGKASKR